MGARTLTVKNLYDKTHKTFKMKDTWAVATGQPEKNGTWLIWGVEKNGKTMCALILARDLSDEEPVLYISAEEGTGKTFIDACKRAQIPAGKRGLNFVEYEPIEELRERLKKRKAPRVIFIDNLTIYADELNKTAFRQLLRENPDKLFVCLAHEERKEPDGATAKLCRKLAKIVIHVKGLACTVSGRCPGGKLAIDEEKAALYHGQLELTTI
jgi:hypothetical protein